MTPERIEEIEAHYESDNWARMTIDRCFNDVTELIVALEKRDDHIAKLEAEVNDWRSTVGRGVTTYMDGTIRGELDIKKWHMCRVKYVPGQGAYKL